jgi:predicted unusual protein kinase regulating ubiquinone biosynthesis (AarF/ABC1/UbiB family)
LEFGLFHGDPHPGNIFCLRDGRIAYVDFGNVAQLSNSNKQVRQQFSDMFKGGALVAGWRDNRTVAA